MCTIASGIGPCEFQAGETALGILDGVAPLDLIGRIPRSKVRDGRQCLKLSDAGFAINGQLSRK